MGNREDLLAGAKRCLVEKGYSRTTARDIAQSSGVSLAGIGYHFKSKEALMNEALFDSMREWGDEMAAILAAETKPDASPVERFAAAWDRLAAELGRVRHLWTTQFELIGQIDHLPELHEMLVAGVGNARTGLAELLEGTAEDPVRARLVGAFYQAMLTGFLSQLLIDPESALSGTEIIEAVRLATA